MARPQNLAETLTLTISTTPQIKEWLDFVAATGMKGKTAAEVASRFVEEKVLAMIADGSFNSLTQTPPTLTSLSKRGTRE